MSSAFLSAAFPALSVSSLIHYAMNIPKPIQQKASGDVPTRGPKVAAKLLTPTQPSTPPPWAQLAGTGDPSSASASTSVPIMVSPKTAPVTAASRCDFSKVPEKADKRLADYKQNKAGLDAELARIKQGNQQKDDGDVGMGTADPLSPELEDPPLDDPTVPPLAIQDTVRDPDSEAFIAATRCRLGAAEDPPADETETPIEPAPVGPAENSEWRNR